MVCDKVACVRGCVCVKLLYVKFVCVKLWYVTCVEVEAGGGRRRREEEAGGGGADPGYRIKNKNPTQSCGE